MLLSALKISVPAPVLAIRPVPPPLERAPFRSRVPPLATLSVLSPEEKTMPGLIEAVPEESPVVRPVALMTPEPLTVPAALTVRLPT